MVEHPVVGTIGEDPHQFASQITGRLLAHAARPGIPAFLKQIEGFHCEV
jgi:hypothetical protein